MSLQFTYRWQKVRLEEILIVQTGQRDYANVRRFDCSEYAHVLA